MKVTAAIFAFAASSAYAQSGITSFLSGFSQSCQTTLLSLATSGDFASCIHVSQVLPLITPLLSSTNSSSNQSLIPLVDQLSAIECGQAGCSNATLTSTYNSLISGCSSDLSMYNITNSTLKAVFQQYPLAREIVCLKTSAPFNGTAPTPVNSSSYNSTNGTFCSTSLLTDISSKFNSNISISFFTQLYQSYRSGNLSSYASKFNASDLCNDCIFATADLIGRAYPAVGNLTLGKLLSGASSANASMNGNAAAMLPNGSVPSPVMSLTSVVAAPPTMTGMPMMNSTLPGGLNNTQLYNTTLNQLLDGTCAAKGFMYTTNGTLPSTIYLSAIGGTFGYNLTAGNQTYMAPSMPTPIKRRNVAAVKARWVGEA